MVERLYSSDYDGTIITPTAIVKYKSDKYQGYMIVSNYDNGTKHLKLLHMEKLVIPRIQ